MRFVADVNVSRHVVVRLRELGLDVMRSSDVLDPRAPDDDIIAEARRRGAVLLTHDQDFTAILGLSGAAGPSLLNVRVSYVDAERIAHTIAAAVTAAAEDLEAGAIVTVDDGGLRIRRLPLS
jgi:predicted nuclease of predicted toxin-antitoxin system